jgi:hypothetical protein
MLNAAGVPAELYKGTITMQAMPAALRLFQQTWPHLVAAYNGWIRWLVDGVSKALNWEPVSAQMQPVTLADDVENKQILLQLAAGNKVSMHKALAPLGIDPDEDIKTIFEENAQFQSTGCLSAEDAESSADDAEHAVVGNAVCWCTTRWTTGPCRPKWRTTWWKRNT